ncbi:Uncharacterised protein [Ralstonia pickettii]|uniref:hypothetical protein n=1 Tax=Ralstonia pickettii TaxID=329 RepID=UPI000501FDF0|nr:hypothetical protein [Ralstonia pickettii]KFL24324.1 hypothetical protein DP23_4084 [Ralstonia pickettii]QQK36988.1 hypothetical protein RP6297_03226 [Ralstonia pickettii]UCA15807.1 hypothetical protein LA354_07390 [Ralstonia pickettii]SUE01052.1 Uncharacterised protein [Ralstonia pickettii]
MAEADFSNATKQELRIRTNRGGNRVFENAREMLFFAKETASDLASLTVIIQEATDAQAEPGFLARSIGAMNDMAWQLEQALEILCAAEERQRKGA